MATRGADQARDDDESKRMRDSLRGRGNKVVEAWEKLVATARHEAAGKRSYSPFDKDKTAITEEILAFIKDAATKTPGKYDYCV